MFGIDIISHPGIVLFNSTPCGLLILRNSMPKEHYVTYAINVNGCRLYKSVDLWIIQVVHKSQYIDRKIYANEVKNTVNSNLHYMKYPMKEQ